MAKNIILVGSPSVGKSTIAPKLAYLLGYGLLDTDAVLAKRQRMSAGAIYRQKGEEFFRDLESKLLEEIALLKSYVIATGGGMPCHADNWKLLSALGTIVWIKAETADICHRFMCDRNKLADHPVLNSALEADNDDQILLKLKDRVEKLTADRAVIYQRASYVINSSHATPDFCALMVKRFID
ncbi:MAG: hypothetical protein OYH77_01820 [Pseudomonadota bacterium]|nr:hypothetical protein [Pseudomonadota bacterium]